MVSVPLTVAAELRDALALARAVETGTFHGEGARHLAQIYPSVVTIELDEACHREAVTRLVDVPHVLCAQGDSAQCLGQYVTSDRPSLYFLDGHWSGGPTSGRDNQCPLMAEIAALHRGHPQDCIVIDDAFLFLSAPAPPYDADDWPTLLQVIDGLRAVHPGHHITVLQDQIFAVPAEARSVIDRHDQRLNRRLARTLVRRVIGDHLQAWSPTRVRLRRWRVILRAKLEKIDA